MAARSKRDSARQEVCIKRGHERAKMPVRLIDIYPNSPVFAAEAHQQSLVIANSPQEADDETFVVAISVKLFN